MQNDSAIIKEFHKNTEQWESRELGADEHFAQLASKKDDDALMQIVHGSGHSNTAHPISKSNSVEVAAIWDDNQVNSKSTACNDGTKVFISGIKAIDDVLKPKPGDLIVIGGHTCAGKSMLLGNIQTHLAKVNKNTSILFSIQLSIDSLLSRILSAQSGIDLPKIQRAELSESELSTLSASITANPAVNLMVSTLQKISVDDVRKRIQLEQQSSESIVSVGIDHLGLMSDMQLNFDACPEISTNNAVVIEALKALAVEFNCVIYLNALTHHSIRYCDDRLPITDDLYHADAIKQHADHILLMRRADYYKGNNEDQPNDNIVQIIHSKKTDEKSSYFELSFDGKHARFSTLLQ